MSEPTPSERADAQAPVATPPAVMGILNVTPDSFSDGGHHLDVGQAIERARVMIEEGAVVIDVGGESTRPHAVPVPEDVELARVLPVVEALADVVRAAPVTPAGDRVRISIDTTKETVARAAVNAGADLINDVSATLAGVAGDCGVGWVAMHRQGTPATMQDEPRYDDVVEEVAAFLDEHAEHAAGIGVGEIWIDPGIGFGKSTHHNLTLLANIDRLVALGWPVVIGASRKATIGRVLTSSEVRGRVELPPEAEALPPLDLPDLGPLTVEVDDRLDGSVAVATWAMMQGAAMIRAHDVLATVQAAKVVAG